MGRRGVAVAVVLSLACAAGAAGCYWKAGTVRRESAWMLARASAQADEYASSFDGKYADEELSILAQRRDLFDRAVLWQRFQDVLVLGAVAFAFATYGLYLAGTVTPVEGFVPVPYEPPPPAREPEQAATL